MTTITDKIRDKFRSVLMFDQNMLILAALLGFLAGFASTFFRWMIEFFESIFSIKGFSLAGIPPQTYPFLLPLMPMVIDEVTAQDAIVLFLTFPSFNATAYITLCTPFSFTALGKNLQISPMKNPPIIGINGSRNGYV